MINEKMRMLGAKRSTIREIFEYGKARKAEIGCDNVFDFSLGNPSVPTPEKVNQELIDLIKSEGNTTLHAYTSAQGDSDVREAIAEYIRDTEGASVRVDCIYMTVGAAAALTSAITAIANCGEEVIVLSPYFPEYKVFIERCGAGVREVMMCEGDFSLDITAISEAINEKTAAIIINSPNNPTGVVYKEEEIRELSEMLKAKKEELGKPIYIISDEPYRELVYDGCHPPYIPNFYNNTIVCYSFSKSLSLPGERIGYIMISPEADCFCELYQAVCGAARALGFVCAPSIWQKVLPKCLGLISDITVYDKNRRLLYDALTECGYKVTKPEGAFYLFVKSPIDDAKKFAEAAKKYELLLVPSDDFGLPGYVRISYCVETLIIKRALPAFKKLIEEFKNELT